MRVSVIVPAYNRASFLPACIESIRKCGEPDVEIIVVDDGSKDNTREVVESLQPGIRYIFQENRGLPAARNTGIRNSSGKYISYLDSDDTWIPGAVRTIADQLDRHPEIGMIFADAQVGNPKDGFQDWSQFTNRSSTPHVESQLVEPGLETLESLSLYRAMLRINLIFTGAVMIRRELVLSEGMFDERLKTGEDWEVWLRLLHRCRFARSHLPMAVYLKHDGAMTADSIFMQRSWIEALRLHLEKTSGLAIGPEDRLLVERKLTDLLRGCAWDTFAVGRYAESRKQFGALMQQEGWSLKNQAMICLMSLPSSWLDGLRNARRNLLRTG
jgi:glycosyltransferase involved in cell wall biosynthesis